MANFFQNLFNWGNAPRTPILESGAHGRKLEDFEPTRKHINAAIQEAGDTIDARLRWAYNNIPLYGGAADQWASSAIVDGIKPMPIIKGYDSVRDALIKRWWRWVDEADYYGRSSFYGLQQLIAREVFLMGECFVILRSIKPTTSYVDLPFRLEVLPKEMLDVHYDAPAKIEGHYIRMGIEFDANDQCVAYHFFTRHPADYTPFTQKNRHQTYVRVDAVDVIHVCENRDAGQLRGLSRATRSLIKFFELNCYDEAELDRKC
ncbi:phage portal protein [Bartonella sp. DGB2]|uniref:phage portal protein n=1 Tax=Bartonella sp. DGB2 TaxID=3388426 RepID=UPI00398FA3B7